MPVHEMLDDREAEPGAAEFARTRRIDAIEPFGQPGQMLAGDPLALIGDRNAHLGRRRAAAVPSPRLPVTVTSLSGRRVLDRVVDEVLKDLDQLVAVPLDFRQIRRQARTMTRMPRSAARNSRPRATSSMTGASATRPVGATCSFSSMRDSESRSSTSLAMRLACSCMIVRNRSRAAASSRAGPSSVSIKPISAANRRLQFVPGIRDEVRPHLFGPLQGGDVVEDQKRDRAVERRPVDPGEMSTQHPIG